MTASGNNEHDQLEGGDVLVYGFGSFFMSPANAKDIDLLLIHLDLTAPSCRLALACKHAIMESYPTAHVTVLSRQEEAGAQFIDKAQAKLLGVIDGRCINEAIGKICRDFQFSRLS